MFRHNSMEVLWEDDYQGNWYFLKGAMTEFAVLSLDSNTIRIFDFTAK